MPMILIMFLAGVVVGGLAVALILHKTYREIREKTELLERLFSEWEQPFLGEEQDE